MVKQNLTYYWLYAIAFAFIVAVVTGRISYNANLEETANIVVENLHLNHQLSISKLRGEMESLEEEIIVLAGNQQVQNLLSKQYALSEKGNWIDKTFEDWAHDCVDHFGFYDLILVNAAGDVIYTVAKEDDLGTNLLTGNFKTSNLGDLYREVVATKTFSGVDFAVYRPSNDELAGFLGAPVYAGDKFLGLLAIQLPTSFEKLNIGVHIEHIKDYIVTSSYVFQANGNFNPIDSLDFTFPREYVVAKSRDSLSIYTPFALNDFNWGILSIAPPAVFVSYTDWNRIIFEIVLAVLFSFIISVLAIDRLKARVDAEKFTASDIVLIQNTWHQLMSQKKAVGTDFYYRVKNKLNLKLGQVNDEEEIEELGKEIEEQVTKIIKLLSDEKALNEKLSRWAGKSLSLAYPPNKLLRLPALFLESFEDERGKELPIRVRKAWEKVARSLVHQLISLMKVMR